MGEYVVGPADGIRDGEGIVVTIEGRSIGVFNVDGEFFALRNRCAHQGGPLCTGAVFPLLDARVDDQGEVHEFFDRERCVVACPWHGWEYDLRTGRCPADPSRRVMTYPAQVRDGEVVVTVGRAASRTVEAPS